MPEGLEAAVDPAHQAVPVSLAVTWRPLTSPGGLAMYAGLALSHLVFPRTFWSERDSHVTLYVRELTWWTALGLARDPSGPVTYISILSIPEVQLLPGHPERGSSSGRHERSRALRGTHWHLRGTHSVRCA